MCLNSRHSGSMDYDASRPFRRLEALEAGVSAAELRRRRRSGEVIALRKGTYVERAVFEQSTLADVLAVAGPQREIAESAVCLESAAQFHGFDLLGKSPKRLALTRPAGPRRTPWDSDGLRVLAAALPAEHVVDIGGVQVTSGARTVVDIARRRPFRAAVVVADSALRRGVTREELEAVLRDCRGWPGVRRAAEVVRFADGRAENPLESVGRVMMRNEGLPAPELQVDVYDEDGEFIARVDFLVREHRAIGEADGRRKYTDPQVLWDEKVREDRLRDQGYEMVRFGWDDALHRGPRTAARFKAAFARNARRSA